MEKEEIMKMKMKFGMCRYNLSCTNHAFYNYAGLFETYCVKHKKEDMINYYPKKSLKTCQQENCNRSASYNLLDTLRPRLCRDHKTLDMESVKGRKCISSWCNTSISGEKYEGYCSWCYSHLFPEKRKSKNYKTKELSVQEFILESLPEYSWITDKKVFDGCSKRRPDLLLDLGYQVIIIEVDENQHMHYDCSCENKRLMELSQDLGHRNIIFIRFNPDDYINDKGVKVKSSWHSSKSGILQIQNKHEWNERLIILKNCIHYWVENKTDKLIEVIQLYYNQS